MNNQCSDSDDKQGVKKNTINIPPTEVVWTESDEQLLKKKIEELRKRDPFIYR
jgi:hypothetical protein